MKFYFLHGAFTLQEDIVHRITHHKNALGKASPIHRPDQYLFRWRALLQIAWAPRGISVFSNFNNFKLYFPSVINDPLFAQGSALSRSTLVRPHLLCVSLICFYSVLECF